MTLILDEESKGKIKELKAYAEKNTYSMDDLFDIKNGAQEAPGNNAFFSCALPVGYKIVYTVENQVEGALRHLSVSVNGGLPSVESVKLIMSEFEFVNELENCYVYLETGGKAINVIELMN